MPQTFFGLPLHPLVVHATVVLVPMAAAAVLLAALWPRFRRWAGWGPLALSLAAVVLTPLSTSTGESLEHQVGSSALVEQHSHLADLLIWWVVPLAVLAGAQYWLLTLPGGGDRPSAALITAAAAMAVVLSLGTLVQVVLIGHSGARAAWAGTGSSGSSSASAGGDADDR
jgi:hypothetical protein